MSYKYQYNHNTDTVRVQDVADSEGSAEAESEEDSVYRDLNIVHLACIFDQEQVLELLALYGVAAMKESVASKDPSLVSVWCGALSALHSLHRLGFSLMAPDSKKKTSLHVAGALNHHKVVEYLLNTHDDIVDLPDGEGRTALHYSSLHSAQDSLAVLLSHGAEVNSQDRSGLSPLHLSTDHGVVSRLLQHGADPCLTNTGQDGERVTAFSHLLTTVPEECTTLLTSLITTNNLSLSASNLQLRLSFTLWQKESKKTESDGLLRIVASEQEDLLKHPVTESFLHLKNAQIGWIYLAYNFGFYLAFLLNITGLIFTNHSGWFRTILEQRQATAHTAFLSLTLICLVVYILIELFKLLVIFDINLDNPFGYFSWLIILTVSTVYAAMVRVSQ